MIHIVIIILCLLALTAIIAFYVVPLVKKSRLSESLSDRDLFPPTLSLVNQMLYDQGVIKNKNNIN